MESSALAAGNRSKIAELEKEVQSLMSAVRGPSSQPQPQSQVIPDEEDPISFNFAAQPESRTTFIQGITLQDVSTGSPLPGLHAYTNPNSNNNANPALFNVIGDPGPVQSGRRAAAITPKRLKSMVISTHEIDDHFKIFFEHYHPTLPFLDPSKSPDEYYESAPILFWVIVSVASRRYRDDMLLFPVLCQWVPKLLWESISTPPYTIAIVQAIILACTWPFPANSMWNDTVVTLSSIAVSIAMQLGLHRPLNATDFLRKKATAVENDCQMRAVTWAAANIISQTSEATYGSLPTTPFDCTIEASCKPEHRYSLPRDLRFKLVLQRYCHRVTSMICRDLTGNEDPFSPGPRVETTLWWENELLTLENRLTAWEVKHADQFTLYDRIYVGAAVLYTQSMNFFDSSDTESRKLRILKAYDSAASYIRLVAEADRACNFCLYISSYHSKVLITACCILLKVLRSAYVADVDSVAGRELCNQAMIVSSKCSVTNNDSMGKVAKLVAHVWHSSDTVTLGKPPQLLFKSRLGASILYDFIWTWRQEFGGQPEAYPKSRQSTDTDTDTVLPPTTGDFNDAAMVDLDFLNDPDWVESITNLVF